MVYHVGTHFRLPSAEAEELVQEFILDKFFERNLLEHADRNRGRFRALLVTTINRFVIDELRRKGNRPLISDVTDDLPASNNADPFEMAWAESILTEALIRTAKELTENERAHFWELFHTHVVQPAFGEPRAEDYAELSQRLGFDSPRAATNALVTVKRTFRRVLEQLSVEAGEDNPDDFVAEIMQIISRRATPRR